MSCNRGAQDGDDQPLVQVEGGRERSSGVSTLPPPHLSCYRRAQDGDDQLQEQIGYVDLQGEARRLVADKQQLEHHRHREDALHSSVELV